MRRCVLLAAGLLLGGAAASASPAPVPVIAAEPDACRLDTRVERTGVVLRADRDGRMYADVHATGPHLPGDVHLWWGFNLYNSFVPAQPADGLTRVPLDARLIEALVALAAVSFELPGGQEVEFLLPSAPRLVAELEACVATPFGADWRADLPASPATPWRVENGPGFLACAYAAPLPDGGTLRIARSAHALGTFVALEREGLPAGRLPSWFVFAGGWAVEAALESEDGVATIGLYAENEVGTGLATFTSVIVVVADLVIALDLPSAPETLAEMARCRAGMERWR
ncbi:MAG: hypothetical protein ACFE0R_01080 [Salinarimonas sp.]